ncbi:MAG: hypothetical protein B7O98_06410 [Zestosphaera tikiterensis]|uniref:Uncharacterized protein n=1 Tax=Zestosphaera tikiterensis TaxID=1973259 RepID=A0A2R7Y451_9CREN|nr:MAG: hypothetical protein B7O98_06410 [Zestosphaera tikiterensis]
MVDLYVKVSTVFGAEPQKIDVAPVIEVTPIQTANVNPDGTSKNIEVNFYGFKPSDSITSVTFTGPTTESFSVTVNVGSDGSASTTIPLKDITGYGLPRGTYTVSCTPGTTDMASAKPGSLTIVPQAIIIPAEGNGRCDGVVCESYQIMITGYGFDPKVSVTRIDLLNLNFTKVVYSNTSVNVATNDYGYFIAAKLFKTNMSAGLYIPIVYTAPTSKTVSNTSDNIGVATKSSVVISQSAIYNTLGTKASVTATSFVNGTWQYVEKYSTMSYTLSEVLRIDFTESGKNYRLAANLEPAGIRFTLYNITPAVPVTLNTTLVLTTWNDTIKAYIANYSFSITPTPAYGPGVAGGGYKYWATFYNYSNMILLRLKVNDFVVTYANLSIVYSNVDTGVTKSFYYEYPANLSIVAGAASVTVPKFTDADIKWKITWSMNLPSGGTTYTATLTVTGQPLKGPVDEFRNVGYIVRPILVVIASTGVLLPEQKVTIAAYGYGPGASYYPGYNTLYVYWEKVRLLTTVPLGNDGNATFVITIPGDASFGIHYIYGVDSWKPLPYEYTLSIVVGAKAYWAIPPALPEKPEVSAGYNNTRLEVCPCPGVYSGVGYCDKCVTYIAECDYLGDYIDVTVSGLSPGETLTVRFGDIVVKTVKANSSVETIRFVVPTVPAGSYPISVIGSVSGTIDVTDFMFINKTTNTKQIKHGILLEVVPKILLLDLEKDVLPILVGPGFVRVIGTGFKPGIAVRAVLFNDTDAAYMLNMQVQSWSADARGVLKSPFTEKAGIYVPALEPGAYEVSLAYVEGTKTKVSKAGLVYVINNVSIVTTKYDLNNAESRISNKVDSAIANISSKIDSATTTISSAVTSLQDLISSKLDSIASDLKTTLNLVSDKITGISDKVDTVLKQLDSTSKTLSGVANDVSSIKSDVSSIRSDVSKVSGALSDLKSSIDAIKSATDNIPGIKNSIATLSDTVNKLTPTIEQLRADITGLKTDVASVKNDVASVKTDVSSVKNVVSGLEGSIKSAIDASKAEVGGKVDSLSIAVYIAVIFALLSFIMSLLVYFSMRKAVATK